MLLVIAVVGVVVSVVLGLVVVTILDALSESHEGLVPYDRPRGEL